MKGSSATMSGDPISIENFLTTTTNDVSDSSTSSLSEPFTFCFNNIDSSSA